MGRKDDQSTGFGTGGFDSDYTPSKSSRAEGFGTGGFDPIVEPEKPRTGWDTAKDVGVEIMAGGAGAVDSAQGILNWATGRKGEEKFDADFISSAKEYWQDMKSDYRKQRDAELASAISDPNKSITEHLIENPADIGYAAAGSLLPMLATGGVSGLGAKGLLAVGALKAGSKATNLILGGMAGATEGALMAGDVYNETESGLAAAGALGLGVATGGIGGNVTLGLARRAVGKEILGEGVESALNKSIARRTLTSMFGEGAQEYLQEGGQALLEMAGKDGEIDLMQAAKRATFGAVVGAAMGGGMHPISGEGAPAFKSIEDRDKAARLAEDTRWQEYLVAKGATGSQPSVEEFESMSAEPAFLRRNSEVALAAQTQANAEAWVAKEPNNPAAQEALASAQANFLATSSTEEERKNAAKAASEGAAAATLGAPTVEAATAAFSANQQAQSVLTTGATAVEAAKTVATGTAAPATTQPGEPLPFQGEDEVSTLATAALAAGVDSRVIESVVNARSIENLRIEAITHPSPEIRALAQAMLAQRAAVAPATPAPEPAAAAPAQATLPLEGGKLNTLPPELAGAKPTYGTTQLTFGSDIDRAAYIARNGVKKSRNDARYVDFVTQATGMTEAEVRAHGNKVHAAIKAGTKVPGQPFNVEPIWSAPAANAAPAPAATNEPKHFKEMREKLGPMVALLPKHVQELFAHDFKGSSNRVIRVTRSAQMHTKTIPSALKRVGFTQNQWNEFLTDLKEKVTGTKTEGVQAQIEKGSTVSEMLDYLIANTEPRMAKLAEALKRFGAGNPALDLPYTNMQNAPEFQRGGTAAWEGSGEITGVLNVKGVADEITTLHEITHALTLSWFYTADKKSPLYKELVQMHKDARNQWLSEHPGMTAKDAGIAVRGLLDINEFMAEAVANPGFQEYLMTVRANKSQSAWDKFVGWVRDLLGDPDVDLQMLGQVLAAVEKIAKKSTAVNKTAGANAINPATTSDAEHMSDVATSDLLQSIVADFFKSDDPNAVDDLIAVNEMFGQLSLDGLRNVRTRITDPDSIRLLDAVIARHEAGFDDAFDVINNHIELLEAADATASMNAALGIEEDDFTIPMGPEDTMDDFNLDQVPEYERRAFEATDRMFAAGSHAIISRTINQSEQELRLLVRAAGNRARSDLAQAMLDYGDITAARVAVGNHLNDLMNNDILGAGLDDRNRRDSDPEPSYAKGGRHPIYDFGARLKNAYMTGALTKLAAFWETVFESDGQFKINVDSKSILRGKDSTNDDYSKLMHAYNDAMFEKAKEWAKAHSFPEPKDSPANRVIVSLREQRNGQGKPELKLVVRGRGREFRGENPYLATTSGAGEGSMDFNPYSKQNEIHTTELEGFPGSGDIAYRLFADVANAHGLNLPTADTLMSNNNVRRPWQTVAATMRLKNPDVLSPINSGGAASAYGMDTELWPHLKDRERIGANILRHTHNMLVSRPGNRGRSSKIMVSNGRVFDNLAPLPNGTGFVAKFEPNHPNGVPKGTVIDFNELETRMQRANAIGGNTDSDVEAGRKGGSGTSMAFALMSQLVLDNIENNPHLDVDPTLVEAGAKMGRNREGWFFDKTDEQKSQLQEEIEAVRAFLADPKTSLEDQQAAREVLRSLLSDEIDGKISDLMEEHRSPMTSNGRRGEINRQIATLRMEQRAKRDTMVENIGIIPPEAAFDASKKGPVAPIRIRGEHYSHQKRTELLGSRYGTGYKGAERTRIAESDDPRLRNRVHFYADAGNGVRPESGVGGVKHLANLANIYPAHEDTSIAKSIPNTITGDAYLNAFETAVLDAGYSGYSMPFGQQLAVVVFGNEPIPVLSEEEAGPGSPVVSNALADNPEAPLLNVGLDVGAGARTMKINPSTVKMIIERSGAKILRSNVVASTYTHDGKEITENTFVAELDRPLTETEAELVSTLAQQEAIGQRSTNGNMLYGPKAKEWGAFDPSQFVLLDGTKMGGPTMTEDTQGPVSPPANRQSSANLSARPTRTRFALPPARRTAYLSK
ncbi:MAG: hypothetical protein IPL15_10390 [Comamonadaceae bacterium]|uniref:hypothetical protein n=1 Tax=Candidatus Skiveiella danica TaxID=3386177 RepID=UPI00390B129E|nr:hypothetical protein [Comamonadaceae bacterium]